MQRTREALGQPALGLRPAAGPGGATRRRMMRVVAGAAGAACAPAGGGAGAPPAALAPAKITLAHYDGLTQQAQRWTIWTEAFRARHPQVTTEILQITEVYQDKIATMFAAGGPPDVMIVNGNWAHSWAALGYFLPLDPLIAREKYDLSDFFGPLHEKVYVHRGKRVGLTPMAGSSNVGVNLTHFRNRGVPPPPTDWKDPRWTWEAFLDSARRLHTAAADGSGGVWGTASRPAWQAIWSHGGDLMDANYRECTLDRPEVTEALQFVADLSLKHRVAPTPQQLAGKNVTAMWINGEIALLDISAGSFGSFREQIKGFVWDVRPDPAGPRRRAGSSGGFGACVAAPTKEPAAAWGWVKHWVSPETMRFDVEQQLTNASSRRSLAAQYAEIARKTLGDQPPASLQVTADQPHYQGVHRYTNRWLDMDRIMSEELGPVWVGETTAKDAMRKAKPRIDAIIAEERAKSQTWP